MGTAIHTHGQWAVQKNRIEVEGKIQKELSVTLMLLPSSYPAESHLLLSLPEKNKTKQNKLKKPT